MEVGSMFSLSIHMRHLAMILLTKYLRQFQKMRLERCVQALPLILTSESTWSWISLPRLLMELQNMGFTIRCQMI